MAWYEDINLVAWVLANLIIFAAGALRQRIFWPLAGFAVAVLGYNYFYSQGSNYFLPMLFFVIMHLGTLAYSLLK